MDRIGLHGAQLDAGSLLAVPLPDPSSGRLDHQGAFHHLAWDARPPPPHTLTRGTAVPLAAFLALLLPLLVPPASQPDQTCAPPDPVRDGIVSVRIFNQSRLGGASIAAIIDNANAVWLPNGVSIVAAPAAGAIVVVVSARQSPNTARYGPTSVGSTLFVNGHATPNIELWLGGAEALVSAPEAPGGRFKTLPGPDRDAVLARMLGVALAHELAHYLLDTPRHSPHGLLQANLSLRDLEHPASLTLALNADQRRRLCAVQVTLRARRRRRSSPRLD